MLAETASAKSRGKPVALATALAVSALVGAAVYSRISKDAIVVSESNAAYSAQPIAAYAMHTAHVNFAEADEKCRQMYGTGLATVTDAEMMKWIIQRTSAPTAFVGLRITPGVGWHVNNFNNNNLRPRAALRWQPGEPNNHGGNEYCAEIYQNGNLNDIPCEYKRNNFLCDLFMASYDDGAHAAFEYMAERNPIKNWAMPAKQINYGGRNLYNFFMDIRINGVTPHWTSIIHVGNENGIRVPGIWEHPSSRRQLHFRQRGKRGSDFLWNEGCDPGVPVTPDIGHWFGVHIEVGPGHFTVKYGGHVQCTAHFTVASAPGNLNVYIGDPWYNAAPVTVRRVSFRTK